MIPPPEAAIPIRIAALALLALSCAPPPPAQAAPTTLVRIEDSAPAPATDRSVVANLALCVPADLMTVARFAADWRHWGGYIDICPVLSWSGDRALYILTVRVDRAQIQVDATIERLMAIPHARLLSPDGRLLGELPSAFAGGLPGETVVSFSQLQDGFPWWIDTRQRDAGVSGTFDEPPLIWNPSAHHYEPRPQ